MFLSVCSLHSFDRVGVMMNCEEYVRLRDDLQIAVNESDIRKTPEDVFALSTIQSHESCEMCFDTETCRLIFALMRKYRKNFKRRDGVDYDLFRAFQKLLRNAYDCNGYLSFS